jgi:phage/plasmid primase-like uncharacterized protein
MHCVPVEGDKGKERSGAYVGHQDGRPVGFIQNFKTGVKTNWKATGQVAALGAQDLARMAAGPAQKRLERALERDQQYECTSEKVDVIWTAATPVEAHPYLADKGVQSPRAAAGFRGANHHRAGSLAATASSALPADCLFPSLTRTGR